MNYTKDFNGTYRTQSGRFTFRWAFMQMPDGEVRAYVLSGPGYGERSTDGHSTHRYTYNGWNYICYDPMPKTFTEAIVIAKVWAERTEAYILDGVRF